MKSITVSLTGAATAPMPALGQGLWVNALQDPRTAEALLVQLNSAHLDLLVDLRQALAFERLSAGLALCAANATPAWLLVVIDERHAAAQLAQLAALLKQEGACVRGILVTPAAYLDSYQPDGQWPSGLTPSEAAWLAREYLPHWLIGGGVPTYFTELNRCRPAPGSFDYLTHATSPTVHAADDMSVVQSLQALPDVFRSARHLAAGTSYRVTTSAIGAWRNPYGGQLTPNPRCERLTLSDRDPRQRGLLAAAWTLAHYQAAQRGGVDAIALWAINEPFAAAQPDRYWPIFHMLKGLAQARGKPAVAVEVSGPDIVALAWSEPATAERTQTRRLRLWLANLTALPQRIELSGVRVNSCTLLDAQSYERALSDADFMSITAQSGGTVPMALEAWAVAVIDCHLDIEPGL